MSNTYIDRQDDRVCIHYVIDRLDDLVKSEYPITEAVEFQTSCYKY